MVRKAFRKAPTACLKGLQALEAQDGMFFMAYGDFLTWRAPEASV